MALTPSDFGKWWAALNVEFPVYNRTAPELEVVGKAWYKDLQHQTSDSLDFATRTWRKENSKRPHLADILRLCGTFHGRETFKRKQNTEWTDTNRCPCGCGGVRWALYLPHFNMTRDKLSCVTQGIDMLPLLGGEYLGNDGRGVPVWRYVTDAPMPLLNA